MMVWLQLRASVFSQDYQIRVRIKIRDFEVQEFASLAASGESIRTRRHIRRMKKLRFSKTSLETIF
jgi:hypothetical protein